MKIDFKGTKVSYEIYGEGNELFVFLHGWGASSKLMMPLANLVGKGKACLLIDFPPFGESAEPKFPWNLNDYVDLTAKIIKEVSTLIGKDCFVSAIFAHSFGGRVAIKGLSSNKFQSNFLVLLSSAGIKPKFSLKTKAKVVKYKFLKRIGSPKASKMGSADYKILSPTMKQTFKKVIKEDLTPLCPKIQAKTLIIFGKNDAETPPYMAKKLCKLIPSSRIFLIEEAGHFAFLTHINFVAQIILAFLELST